MSNENLPKAFMIVGAGMLQIPMIEEAKRIGLKTIVTDGDPMAPGFAIDVDESLLVDTYDYQGHAAYLPTISEKYNLVGVATCGADVAPTVAYVAEQAGLPGIPFAVAQKTHNKLDVRAALNEAGMSSCQPAWSGYFLENPQDISSMSYPVVVKPLEQRASRGITIVQMIDEMSDAIDKALAYQGDDKRLLIEAYFEGTEHSAEIIFNASGDPVFFNVVDRMFRYESGCPVETGHINPSSLGHNPRLKICTLLQVVASTLGVKWGPFKADIMVTKEGDIKILECTARLSGGFDCQYTTPLSSGKNPIRQVIELAIGCVPERQEIHDGREAYAACAAAFPAPGKIREIPSQDYCESMMENCLFAEMEGGYNNLEAMVEKIFLTSIPGQTIDAYEHCAQRPGFVIVSADSYEHALQFAEEQAVILADGFRMEKS